MAKAGPIFDIAWSVLGSHPRYRSFLDGGTRQEFSAFLDGIAPDLVAAGLPAEDVHFAKRYPRSERGFVRDTLQTLVERGVLPGSTYDESGYDAVVAAMNGRYDHGRFRTYIYPEEARLLFAIFDIVRPRSALFLGSYYGYWAHAALSALARHGGRAVLIDPDPEAQALAHRNLAAAGLLGSVELVVAAGQDYLDAASASFDLVVLDAEAPRDHPDPAQRGKGIYDLLLRHALPRMTPGALLVCHNILFEDAAGCAYFDRIIARNRTELGPFLEAVRRDFTHFVECTSTEGVGVAKLRESKQERMAGGKRSDEPMARRQTGRKGEEEHTMGEERAMQAADKLSSAVDKYKASLAVGATLTGATSEGDGKLWVVCKSSSGAPVCVEIKRADVVDVQKGADDQTSTVSIRKDADFTVTVAGVTGREYDLPAGLRRIFDAPGEGGGRVA
jgi:predicted O-methyltransferase YrrM